MLLWLTCRQIVRAEGTGLPSQHRPLRKGFIVTEYERGARDAFVAMTQVHGYVPQHVIEAMAALGVTFEIPGLEIAKKELEQMRRETEEFLKSLPPDYDDRRAT